MDSWINLLCLTVFMMLCIYGIFYLSQHPEIFKSDANQRKKHTPTFTKTGNLSKSSRQTSGLARSSIQTSNVSRAPSSETIRILMAMPIASAEKRRAWVHTLSTAKQVRSKSELFDTIKAKTPPMEIIGSDVLSDCLSHWKISSGFNQNSEEIGITEYGYDYTQHARIIRTGSSSWAIEYS